MYFGKTVPKYQFLYTSNSIFNNYFPSTSIFKEFIYQHNKIYYGLRFYLDHLGYLNTQGDAYSLETFGYVEVVSEENYIFTDKFINEIMEEE